MTPTSSPTLIEAMDPNIRIKLEYPYPLDLHTLVPYLLDLYPGWDEFDISNFIEDRTGARLRAEDFQTLRAVYTRVVLLRNEFGV